MAGSVTSTDYSATFAITDDVQGAAALEVVTDVVKSNGMNDGDLVTRLQTYISKHNLLNAHMDLDAGLTANNYASVTDITALVVAPTEDPGISERGINDADLLTLLRLIVTNFNTRNSKLDADNGTVDNNYASLLDIALSGNVQPMDTAIGQQEITDFLELLITNHNALLVKLDADA